MAGFVTSPSKTGNIALRTLAERPLSRSLQSDPSQRANPLAAIRPF
jgi:hypothetical protein